METFPTLSIPPKSLSTDREDATLSSGMEAGYIVTRYKFTRANRRKFNIGYELLNDSDILLFRNFIDTVRGNTDAFYWGHPVTGQFTVRFEKPPSYALMEGLWEEGYLWSTDFVLVEV